MTPDLRLLDAAIDDPPALASALGCEVSEGWVVSADALRRVRDALADGSGSGRWGTRFFVLDEPHTLIGWGGFKGPPREGVVELGYEIAPRWEGRGLATAAVRELVREAFAAPEVQRVIAHTLAQRGPSGRVLERVDFVHDGEVPNEEFGKAWLFRLDRPTGAA